jgi:hypothetical protein
MKNLIDYFTPTTEEHKSFLRHFLGTLTMFYSVGWYILLFNVFKSVVKWKIEI